MGRQTFLMGEKLLLCSLLPLSQISEDDAKKENLWAPSGCHLVLAALGTLSNRINPVARCF